MSPKAGTSAQAAAKKTRQAGMRGSLVALRVTNPKRYADVQTSERLFPYYAGYSTGFIEELLRSVELSKESLTVDPWSGAGTTVHALQKLGLQGLGIDLNPVMVIAGKAGLLSDRKAPSLMPLAESIVETALQDDVSMGENDPLNVWLYADNAAGVRKLEGAINKTFISHVHYQQLKTKGTLDQVSQLAAFFYVALFRAIRRMLRTFVPTNPTWVKRASMPQEKSARRLLQSTTHSLPKNGN